MTRTLVTPFEPGDKVVLKRRPKGHNVPGTVVRCYEQGLTLVEIRPNKCVSIKTDSLELAL